MRKSLTLFVMLIFSGILAFAQTKTISGQVKDAQGNPVSYATVTESGTKNAVTSDVSGNFTIRIKQGSSLTYSATGYDTQTFNVTGDNAIAVINRNTTELSTVVVTALGQVRQAKQLGYSTANVKAKELTQAKVINLQNGLTGKVSGLNIQTVNNGVFANTRITLRGIRSLTGNNQPMLIVDGVPISLNFINSVNPNDIADVTILKSASSTAIYGPEGVNGAIVITTKKGSKSTPLISLSHTVQLERVAFMPEFQTKFGSGSAVDAFGYGVYDPIENQGYGDAFDGSLRDIGRVGPDGKFNRITYEARPNEKKKFWNTGVTNQTDISFSNGDFYLSAQNVDIKGILPKDKNKRVSFHLSSFKDFNKIKASYGLTYTQGNYDVNAGSRFGNGRDFTPYWNLINSPMQINITDYKNWQSDYYSSPSGYYNDYYSNPYWAIDNFREKGRNDDIIGNIEFNYKPTNWLNLTYRLGGTITNSNSKATQAALVYSTFAKASGKSIAQTGDLPASTIDNSDFSSRLNSEIFATLQKSVDKFKLELLLGQSYREINGKSLEVSSANLGIPGVYNISVRKGEADAFETNSKQKLQRFFGKASIGYNNWAFAEVTGSNDIDSRLASPTKFDYSKINFFYPGASLSLVLTEAIPSLKNNFLNFLKIRGAISKTGNVNLAPYSLQNTYSQSNGFPYGTTLGFTANNTLRSSSYKPEFVKTKEAGLEVGFLKNRINLEGTIYTQDNTNQIITVDYSAATGYPKALLNAASFTNKGYELDLKLTPLVKIKNVSVDFKVNYTNQSNEVKSLASGVKELGIGNSNFVIVGQPAYVFKLTDYRRDSATGKVIVDKITGYPSIDPAPRVFGQTLPKHILGLNLGVTFKGLSLSAVADYRSGNQIYSSIGGDLDFSGISYRSGQNNRQPFIFPNSVYADANGKYVENKDVYTQSGGYNFWSQTRNTGAASNYLSSGAFWKLREIALSYALPASLLKDNKVIKGATFTLSGRNLATWLPSTNQWTDPEFSNTTGNAQGVNSRNNTPPTRIFGASLNLQF